MELILASGSPRRRDILGNLGLSFKTVIPDADESCSLTDPARLTEELARRKCLCVRNGFWDCVILSCDTVVFCDGIILGKPHTPERAAEMLKFLSGKTHSVVSGICLAYGDKIVTASEITQVCFSETDDCDIDFCVRFGDPCDKAGAYAVQGAASLFIDRIDGDYFNVVGLPLRLTERKMREEFGFGLERFHTSYK